MRVKLLCSVQILIYEHTTYVSLHQRRLLTFQEVEAINRSRISYYSEGSDIQSEHFYNITRRNYVVYKGLNVYTILCIRLNVVDIIKGISVLPSVKFFFSWRGLTGDKRHVKLNVIDSKF